MTPPHPLKSRPSINGLHNLGPKNLTLTSGTQSRQQSSVVERCKINASPKQVTISFLASAARNLQDWLIHQAFRLHAFRRRQSFTQSRPNIKPVRPLDDRHLQHFHVQSARISGRASSPDDPWAGESKKKKIKVEFRGELLPTLLYAYKTNTLL